MEQLESESSEEEEKSKENGFRALHRRPSDGRWFEGFELSSNLVNSVADELRLSRDVAPIGGSIPSMPTLYLSSWRKQADNILHVANAVTSLITRGAKHPSNSSSHVPTVFEIRSLCSGTAINLGADIFLSCLHCAGEEGAPNDFGYHTVGGFLNIDGETFVLGQTNTLVFVFSDMLIIPIDHEYHIGNSDSANTNAEVLLHVSKFIKDVTPLVPSSFSSPSPSPSSSDIRHSHQVLPSEWAKIFPNTATGINARHVFDTTTPECRAYNLLRNYCSQNAKTFIKQQNEKLRHHTPPDAKLPITDWVLDATLFLSNRDLFSTPTQKHRLETMAGKTILLPRILPLGEIEGYTAPDANQFLLVGFPTAIEDEEGNEARFPKGKMMATTGESTTWPPNKQVSPEYGPAFIRSLTHPWSQLHICSGTKGTSGGPIIDLSLPKGQFIGIDCGHLESSSSRRRYRRGEDVEYLLPVENPLLVGLFLVFVFPALSALGDKEVVSHYLNFFGGPHVRANALEIMTRLEVISQSMSRKRRNLWSLRGAHFGIILGRRKEIVVWHCKIHEVKATIYESIIAVFAPRLHLESSPA